MAVRQVRDLRVGSLRKKQNPEEVPWRCLTALLHRNNAADTYKHSKSAAQFHMIMCRAIAAPADHVVARTSGRMSKILRE
ncbi:hypothetical protein K523DRAFT_325911 [Schizophyllum commune Tattone D]|nr:hypothetical protein K523DRAFT_325911 [Schizophyllum commune Tattone D]